MRKRITKKKGYVMKVLVMLSILVLTLTAKADGWMTFCMTPAGKQYSQMGYVKPDADGFVTVKAGPVFIRVYKTRVWYMKTVNRE